MPRYTPLAIAIGTVLAVFISSPLPAQSFPDATQASASAPAVAPDAQAVLDRMSAYLRSLNTFSISANSTRDEVLAFGYKLQNSEHTDVTVQRPDRLRAQVSGDIRDRTFVYDGSRLTVYSPDDHAYARIPATGNLAGLVQQALDAGVDMPMVDVVYEAAEGTLTEGVRNGVLIGPSRVNGVDCDQLAFRQDTIDWQIWIEKGDRPLPRKIVITTRFEVGDPQFQVALDWNLSPKITKSTFVFAAPSGANEIPFEGSAGPSGNAQ